MSDNDPFAEPDDSEKTVIRPNPGGRRSPTAASPTSSAQPETTPAASSGDAGFGVPTEQAPARTGNPDVEQGMTGMNPLNACAATLFALVSRIRNRAQHMDPDKLRRSVVSEIRGFENRALQAGLDAQDVKVARYAICATLDDVVLNTPWGGQSVWTQQSMVGTFHRETVGGDRFYDLLARLEKDPSRNINLLEFLYVCLSLGFEGRLRVEQGGPDRHMQIRAGLARIISDQRGQSDRELSPHWQGLDEPYRPRSLWRPVWITTGVVAMILTAMFLTLTFLLNGTTNATIGRMAALDNGLVAELLRRAPPPPPPPQVDDEQIEEVKEFLRTEIDEGVVTVFQDANTITMRIIGRGMFKSGSDQLDETYLRPLERVASALNEEPGPVIVVGHSDNIPIKSSRFPSNMHLSLARATSVMKKLAGTLSDPSRLSAEGRADRNPIAPNDTADGRARNRRIEIVLVRRERL